MIIYTDGSCIPGQDKRGYAGMGIWFGKNDKRNQCVPLDDGCSTNQYAELKAIEVAIAHCRHDESIEIRTDSQYSIKCITVWGDNWDKNGWITTKKTQVLHSATIKRIRDSIALMRTRGIYVTLTYVKGHATIEGNVEADRLAGEASKIVEHSYMSQVVYFDSGVFNNYYPSTISVETNNIPSLYYSAGHFIQYQKAIMFNDKESATSILLARSPATQRQIGHDVIGFSQTVWDITKQNIVLRALRAKFTQQNALKERLLSTGSAILAQNGTDLVWTVGISRTDAHKGVTWAGKNMLGTSLMKIRNELRQFEQ